jgi:peptide/nickel transport system substrate-binding protein
MFAPAEWRLVRLLAALAAVSLAIGTIGFLSAHLTLVARAGGRYTEVIVGSPQYVNPLLAPGNDADEALVRLLYAGLLGRDGEGRLQPALAEGVDRSDDGKVYTAHLRPNVRWPDGEPLTAQDVLNTYETLQDSSLRLPIANRMRGVKVEVVDDATVRFTLTTANPLFPAQLTLGILPAHLWANVDPTKFALVEYNLKPVGLGPFQLKELRRDRSGQVKSYTLIRSNAWPGSKPNLAQIVLRFVNTADEATRALSDRSAEGFATEVAGPVPKVRRGVEHRIPTTEYVAVFLNERATSFKDPAVRRGLAAATDRAALTALTAVRGRVVDTPVLPGAGALNEPLFPAFDTTAAEKILDDAGWKRPTEGATRAKGNDKLAFTLTTVDDPGYDAVADALKAQWTAIGADVTVDRVDPAQFSKSTIKTRRYDALLFAEQVGLDGDLYPFWHSTQERDPGLNLSTFFRKDIDAALEGMRSATDEAARTVAVNDFQHRFADELPALVLYQPELSFRTPSRLGGIAATRVSAPADRFNDVAEWYVRRRLAWK